MATPFFDDQVRLAKLSLMRRRIAQMAADRQRQQTVHPLAALFQILEPTEPPPQAPPGPKHSVSR